VAAVRERGGNASHHARSGMRSRPGGWGNYSLTIMGPHRAYWYRELCRKIADGGLGEEEVVYLLACLLAGLLASQLPQPAAPAGVKTLPPTCPVCVYFLLNAALLDLSWF